MDRFDYLLFLKNLPMFLGYPFRSSKGC
ncbi:hypothetical protein RSC3_02093 [Bacillus paralicheniformis]|nr:hypothetical protein RSC3_02093 [Bacillus paralicheniformis]